MQTQKKWFDSKIKRAGISQRELARRVNLDASAVYNITVGKRSMSAVECYWIAKELRLSPSTLCRMAAQWHLHS